MRYSTRRPAKARNGFLAICLILSVNAYGRDADELIEYSLDQLVKMDVVIRVANKLDENLVDTAGAVYVMDAHDIRRSGVRSIPDALRLVPGVQVGQISANEWAISIRGLNGRFSRHLLVLVDGRSVYNPSFGGVNWDEYDIPVQDIERIEVIRGPAGQVWGSNAVNGVINIVTRKRSEGTATLAVGAGNLDKWSAHAQTGGEMGPGRYRLSLASNKREGLIGRHRGMQENTWESNRFSLDYGWQNQAKSDEMTVGVDYFETDASPYVSNAILSPPYNLTLSPTEQKNGYALQLQYNRRFSERNEWRTRFSVDSTSRESELGSWDSRNADVDLEYMGRWYDHHLVNTGINLRFSESSVVDTPASNFRYRPQSRELSLLGFYLQDTYQLGEMVKLTLGTKVEKHSEVGTSVQPTLRALWKMSDNQRVWAAVSKAESTPARSNYDSHVTELYTIEPGAQTRLPILLELTGRPETAKNTILRSIEAGYRYGLHDVVSVDLAGYYNEYHNLFDIAIGSALVPHLSATPQYLELPLYYTYGGTAKIQGLEANVSGSVNSRWALEWSSSFTNQDYRGALDSESSGLRFITVVTPDSQHILRSSHDIGGGLELDVSYRYVAAYEKTGIESYSALDLRLGWQVSDQLAATLRVENLSADKHTEFYRELYYVDTFEVGRSVFFELKWTTR